MVKFESKRNLLKGLVIGFSVLHIIIGVFLILLLNILAFGLFCFTLDLSLFYIALSNSSGSQTSELEIKAINHALAISKSIQHPER